MWIWAAMFDLKAHVLHGKTFSCADRAGIVIPLVLAVAAITAASFYLNAVFAFAIVSTWPTADPGLRARRGLTCLSCWDQGR